MRAASSPSPSSSDSPPSPAPRWGEGCCGGVAEFRRDNGGPLADSRLAIRGWAYVTDGPIERIQSASVGAYLPSAFGGAGVATRAR